MPTKCYWNENVIKKVIENFIIRPFLLPKTKNKKETQNFSVIPPMFQTLLITHFMTCTRPDNILGRWVVHNFFFFFDLRQLLIIFHSVIRTFVFLSHKIIIICKWLAILLSYNHLNEYSPSPKLNLFL